MPTITYQQLVERAAMTALDLHKASTATKALKAELRSNKKPIPQGVRALVFERDGWACLRCGCSKQHRLRADHVVPESKGGPATLENLQTLCMSCNSWKGVKTVDFRSSAKVMA